MACTSKVSPSTIHITMWSLMTDYQAGPRHRTNTTRIRTAVSSFVAATVTIRIRKRIIISCILRLPCDPLPDGSVYLNGELFNNVLDEKSKMGYNFGDEAIRKSRTYSNREVTITSICLSRPVPSVGQTGPIEGNYYQTQNEYSIYVYYRPMGARYDRLIGVTTVRNEMQVF